MPLTEKQAVQLVGILAATYPNATITDATPGAYQMMLKDADWTTLQALLPAILEANPDFCPPAPKIAAAYKAMIQPPRMTAGEAWEIVMDKIKRIGSYGRTDFGNEAIAKAVRDVGGLPTIGMADMERELPFVRKRFDEAFVVHQERQEARELAVALPDATRGAVTSGNRSNDESHQPAPKRRSANATISDSGIHAGNGVAR